MLGFAGAIGLQAKTDKLDAKLIAHYGEAVKPRLSTLKPDSIRLMADLVARQNQILTNADHGKESAENHASIRRFNY